MNFFNRLFGQPYSRIRNLSYLFASLIAVVAISCEPSQVPLREDVAGLLMGMSVFSVLAILSIACSVVAGCRQTGAQILISTLAYLFAYVILKDSGAALVDDILASPKKWLMFSLGGLISYLIFNSRSVFNRSELIISGSSSACQIVKPESVGVESVKVEQK